MLLLVAAFFHVSVSAVWAQSGGTSFDITTAAGTPGSRGATNGTGAAASLYAPSALVSVAGDLIVADAANNIFRRVSASGVVTTFSGRPAELERIINVGSADGSKDTASFFIGEYVSEAPPWGTPLFVSVGSVTAGVDGTGNIYFADTMNHTVRRLAADGSVTTIAGAAGQQGTANGVGTSARFLSPSGVAVDTAGNIYVVEAANYTIRKITPGGQVSTLAGQANSGGSLNGAGAAARFNGPRGIAVDSAGNLYVTDTGNHTVRKISPEGVVSTFAGAAGIVGSSDGSGPLARFNGPIGIAVDSSGNVFVADTGSHTIRRISAAGAVTTVAGVPGAAGGANGAGNGARFNAPHSLTISSSGILYVSDTMNNTIRRGALAVGGGSLEIESQPQRRQVIVNSIATFRVVATGSPAPSYQWQRDGEDILGATAATLTLPAAQFTDAGFYRVKVTSGTRTFTSPTAQLQVFGAGTPLPPIVIVTQPTDREVQTGTAVNFAAEAIGTGVLTYQWRKNDLAIGGAVSPSLTIPNAQLGDAGVYTVVVTDGVNTATSTGATLTVNSVGGATAPVITAQPQSQAVAAGGAVTLTVAATGSPAPQFQWQRNGAPLSNGASGTGSTRSGVNTNQLVLSNVQANDAGSYTVVVTNSAGTISSAGATLTVSTPFTASRIINLSILTDIVGAGADFTMGFVVGGEGTAGSKPLVLRAAGPSLAAFNVPNPLNDPKLEVLAAGSKIFENDNWGGSQALAVAMQSVGAFAYVNGSSRDAAASLTTGAGDKTVRVSATDSGSGTVIAEVYDATPSNAFTATTPRLLNVSVLKNIGAGLKAGFVIAGTGPKTVVIRAIGPSLQIFGVAGAVSNPRLRLFRAQDEINANDNWGGSAELIEAFTRTGAFQLPAGSLDAALKVVLPPGEYTVDVTGVDGTGVALVEVYEMN